MKGFVIVGFLVTVFLQIESRSIAIKDEVPSILMELVQQTYACITKIGPSKASQLPQLHGMKQLPEDNPALNELWGCKWEKRDIINEDGLLSEDKLVQYLADLVSMYGTVPPEERHVLQDIVQQCKNVRGYDYGQTVVKTENCIRNYVQQRH